MDQAFFCFCMKAKTRKIAWKGEKKKKGFAAGDDDGSAFISKVELSNRADE